MSLFRDVLRVMKLLFFSEISQVIYGLTPMISFETTPQKINMEPENEPQEEEIPIRNHHFQVPC